MKKSEMMDRLVRVLKAEKAYPYRGPRDIAEDLLKAMEEAGIQPPPKGGEAHQLFTWEPEDD